MGKGLAFLNLKFFHPSNKDNQKRKWEAMQREKERIKKERERKQELLQEKEIRDTKQMLYNANNNTISQIELKKNELEWMYNVPPGLKKSMENAKKKIEEQNRLNEWQNALNKMDKNERRLAEREIENGLSVHERNVFRFEFLKNAPVVADYVKNMEVTHKPFGIQIRHVKCFKCNKWGHRIGDRECPLNNDKPYLDDTFKNKMDPIHKIKKTIMNKHINKYNNNNNNNNNINDINMDTQSILTMKTDGNDNGNTYQMKKIFNTNDGSKLELISGSENETNETNEINQRRQDKKKKRKKHGKKRKYRDVMDSNDMQYIESLSVEEREYLLKKLKKDQKKHKHGKRKKKKKRRKYSDNESNSNNKKRSRSRSRNRSNKKLRKR